MNEQNLINLFINIISVVVLYSKMNREIGEIKTMITQHLNDHIQNKIKV